MAKRKPRTPPPPRRVQAPKTRTGPSRTASRTSRAQPAGVSLGEIGMRQRAILYGVALSGVVALAAVVILVVVSGGNSGAKAAIKAIRAAGGQFRTYPEQPRTPHYLKLSPSPAPKWNSFPPTSGRHYYQPLVFGIYTEPVPEIRAVHNLEHGAVILQYGDKVSSADVDRITAWYQQDANAVVVAPLPKLGNKVALTAWTRWAETTGFNETVANDFRKAFRYKAPEHFPKSYLEPGH
jgi:Protein of unknown function (DUF3105)